MHILIVASYYPTKARPVLGGFFHAQALALARAGHQVGVLVAPRINASIEHIRATGRIPNLQTATFEEYGGIPVFRMHWGWFPRIFPEVCAWLVSKAGVRAFDYYMAQQGRPNIIHGHNIFYGGYLATRLGHAYDIPVVTTEHSTNFLRGRIFLPGQHRVVRETLANLDHSFAVSQRLAKALHSYTPSHTVEVLGNLIDDSFWEPPQKPMDGPFTFAVVALLKHRIKRIDVLLDAFALAFRNRQDTRLCIGGDGPLRQKLERQVKALGLSEQVEFLGRLDRNGVRDLFQKSHVVVSSSEVETFGVTLIEAMACGKPVVATQSGGPQDFVTPETGILVPVNDVEALAAALIQIRNTYQSYNPSRIRAACLARFGEEAVVGRLNAVYSRLINRDNVTIPTTEH